MKLTQAQFAAYQQVFDYFNRRLFENSLPDGHAQFQSAATQCPHLIYGRAMAKKAAAATPALSLNLQQMGAGEPIEVMATLVREMVHLWPETHGQPSSKWYFNRQRADKMTSIV